MGEQKSGDYRLGYRGDVEGLRAVAILLVVAAHAKVKWLAGGFVGVDVFYVLSGYLITGLLVQEILTTGDLRFARFYARRLRRLLPALVLMLAATCILARLLLPASGASDQAAAAASAAWWVSNFHFAFWHMDYFAPGSAANAFLHTWSLGVEEQFYVVWPLLVVLAMGAWEGARRPPTAARLKYIFGAVFLSGLALSWYWTWHAPQLAFYMMPSRAWQFALGALVFLVAGTPRFHSRVPALPAPWRAAASWAGLAMILASAALIDGRVAYPGTWALLPTFGAALVLAGTSNGWRTANHWLSMRPLQAIGRVSYSWYLWHWPVLLLGAQLIDTGNGWCRLLLVAISLLIAAASYHYFETPIRHNPRLLAKPRLAMFTALALMVSAALLALSWQHAAETRMREPEQLRFAAAHADVPVIYGMGCDDWYHSARVRVCAFGDTNATHTAVAIGDSVAAQWVPALARIFVRPGWRLLVMTKSACPMVDEPLFYQRIRREYTECGRWRAVALRKIGHLKPDVVIAGSIYTYHYTQSQWTRGTRRVLEKLTADARQVFIMRSTPVLPFDGPDCVAPRSWLFAAIKGQSRCTTPAYPRQSRKVYRWLQTAAAPFRNVRFVDLDDAVCPHGICHAKLGNTIVFRDDHHVTASYAASLAPRLARALNIADPTPGPAAE